MAEQPWVDKLARDATRFRIVFLHLGTAFEPYRDQLASLDCSRVDAVALVQSGGSSAGVEGVTEGKPADRPNLLVVDGVEAFRVRRSPSLGELRARVLQEADQQTPIVLVSRCAKETFPKMVGSDLLSDARQHFISLNVPDSDSLSCLPGRTAAADDSAFLRQCLEEVGLRTLDSLGRGLWEYMRSPNEALLALDSAALISLRGAGLVVLQEDGLRWATKSCWKEFRLAVADVSSTGVVPDGDLGQVFVDMWVLERRIRNRLRAGLMSKLGPGWRATCIPEGMREEILERARKDLHPRADKIADLRDPLEWLSTSELLELRLNHQLGDLGMEPYLWTKLREVVLPVRNRVAHMRLLDQQDALDVGTWRAVVEKWFQ